ncbi:hypothetical protein P7K49_015699 [Saguinus oedipus]|uniref:Uncharacterized protein n=1 Tax=Saguinus oedipus TaxID=9490 RepID=A0ABQ9VAS6_SAGOE|nr:hypothetical protein P7K49_015699 [Saguinus oedipus]
MTDSTSSTDHVLKMTEQGLTVAQGKVCIRICLFLNKSIKHALPHHLTIWLLEVSASSLPSFPFLGFGSREGYILPSPPIESKRYDSRRQHLCSRGGLRPRSPPLIPPANSTICCRQEVRAAQHEEEIFWQSYSMSLPGLVEPGITFIKVAHVPVPPSLDSKLERAFGGNRNQG